MVWIVILFFIFIDIFNCSVKRVIVHDIAVENLPLIICVRMSIITYGYWIFMTTEIFNCGTLRLHSTCKQLIYIPLSLGGIIDDKSEIWGSRPPAIRLKNVDLRSSQELVISLKFVVTTC